MDCVQRSQPSHEFLKRYKELARKLKQGELDAEEQEELSAMLDQLEQIKPNLSPIALVFQAIDVVGRFCEKNFHDPEKLRKFVEAIVTATSELK